MQQKPKPDPKRQPKRADNHKGGQGAPPDKSETLPPKYAGSPPPPLNRDQKTSPNKS